MRKNILQLLFILCLSVSSGEYTAAAAPHPIIGKSVSYPEVKIITNDIKLSGAPLPANLQIDALYPEGLLAEGDPIQEAKMLKVRGYMEAVKESNNFVTNLIGLTNLKFPLGIKKEIGGLEYIVCLGSLKVHDQNIEVDIGMSFELPQNGKTLSFYAEGVRINDEGGISGDIKLGLVGDFAINFTGDKQQLILRGLTPDGVGTYVKAGCDGFQEMGIDAIVNFSRDLLLPENEQGEAQNEGNVRASFQTVLSNWNDLVAEITLPNFQIKGVKDFGFTVEKAVFDFSDLRNAPGVKFPAGYVMESDASLANTWRGIYIQKVSVRLPHQFNAKGGASARTSLNAYDLLIDGRGVSGKFTGEHLLGIDKGTMNGWAFSVEHLEVSLLTNQIQSGALNGDIVVPVGGKQNAFKYNASIGMDDQYLFQVTTVDTMRFTLFKAGKVQLLQGSMIEVKVENGRFLPRAVLNGTMEINTSLSESGDGKGVSLADIRFENLQIQSVRPYLQAGTFSFGSEQASQAMAGFPVSISEIGMSTPNEGQVSLDFKLKINLTGSSGGLFAAEGGLGIVGELTHSEGIQQWRFKTINVKKIGIDIDQGSAFKFRGSLVFYKNDPTYGEGFNGQVDATFAGKIGVKASAIFGSASGQRYWYVDGMVTFSTAIPFLPAVGIYGFGGGAYYGMKMGRASGASSQLGETASGVSYIPAVENGLGLKAIVFIGSMPTDKAFKGDVTLEISFYKGGGIHAISFLGNAFIATPGMEDGKLEKLKGSLGKMQTKVNDMEAAAKKRLGGVASIITPQESSNVNDIFGDIGEAAGGKGAISARIFISYDFGTQTLHGNFTCAVNVAGGAIKGGGESVMHFAPGEWYVYVGTPDKRFTLSVGVASLRVNATSYFMVGTNIPGSPPPPAQVASIVGSPNLNYMKDLNAIRGGGGFAFGLGFNMDTGDLTFLMFYARFQAGLGFDIMLKQYENAVCEGSNNIIGVNGWYANGQAYAYFMGDIGIRVRVFRRNKSVSILRIEAAAILQAKLPNPTWARGIVGGSFSILGGLVKGNCKFQVDMGNDCKIVRKSDVGALSEVEVISQLTPANGDRDVNVFNNPQAIFNMPVDKEFVLTEDDGSQQSYKINLDKFELVASGNKVNGTLEWNQDHTVAAFNSHDVLPPQQSIKLSVAVSFEKLVGGAWQKVTDRGQPYVERQEIDFTTGTAPDYIPHENVLYCYPVVGQLNFYKNESAQGYIKLKKGQPYLFPADVWNQEGRFIPTNNKPITIPFTYDVSQARVSFSIPQSTLSNGQIYSFQLINVPKNASGTVDRNVTAQNKNIEAGDGSEVAVTTKKAEGSLTQLEEKNVFSMNFRTSQYSLLSEKLQANAVTNVKIAYSIPYVVYNMQGNFQNPEPFDQAELSGTTYTQGKPLLAMEADFTNNDLYNKYSYPLIYADYPIGGVLTIENRTPGLLGIPPAKGITIRQPSNDLLLDQNNPVYTPNPAASHYYYDVLRYMYADYLEIRAKIANTYITQSSITSRMKLFFTQSFPGLTKGEYKFNVKYVEPNHSLSTTNYPVTLTNQYDY